MTGRTPRFINLLQEFSIPLISGVVVAMLAANFRYDWYHHALEWMPFGAFSIFGHEATLHFLVNDVFMVFFFGIAAKEITESCLPGGSLNPITKSINPLLAATSPAGTNQKWEARKDGSGLEKNYFSKIIFPITCAPGSPSLTGTTS